MSPGLARRALGGLLVAAAAVYFRDGLAGQAARLAGHVDIDPARILAWSNSTALNNAACTVDYAANACEDVVVHFSSSTAFLACGDPVGRSKWYPPAGQRNVQARAEASFREQLFKHDIKTGLTTELAIHGLEGDFVTHGIDIWPSPADPSVVHIFAVRHARDGDSISIFSHTLGTDSVELVRDVKHRNIKTANGVAAVGPLEFYLTNDHYFYNDPWRSLEEKFGPWTWATNVQYCDASEEATTVCKQVAGSYPAANGIAVWDNRLFVGDSKIGTLMVFRRLPDKNVEFENEVALGAAADNIKIDPSTGDLIMSIFPTLENLSEYLANVEKLGKELRVPVAALRLPKSNGYTPELIFFDDGGVLSDMTAMAIDPYNNVLIGAAVLQYGGFAVCKVGQVEA